MHAIGATLTSGGGTLLICVHQFTVAFGARDDTRQRASEFRSYARDCACAMPSLQIAVALGGDRTGRTQLEYPSCLHSTAGCRGPRGRAAAPDTARGGAAQAGKLKHPVT